LVSSSSVISNSFGQKFTKTTDGIIVYPKQDLSGDTHAIRIETINDRIIKITASPDENFRDEKSLIAIYRPSQKTSFSVSELPDSIQLKTNALTVTVSKKTGGISFADVSSKRILQEKQFQRSHF
jgi:alpha-D-xyloside xylohydrolase